MILKLFYKIKQKNFIPSKSRKTHLTDGKFIKERELSISFDAFETSFSSALVV